MMRSLYTGVTGLTNHQTRMDVLSNNIANVNTIGFKGSRTVFSDTLSQTMQGASGPSTNLAGTNAKQIGLGMKVSAIDIMFTPTSFQTTNKTTDLAISDNGFFIVRDGAQQFYTRAGNFDFDKQGNMFQTGSGLRVMGWNADANGNVNTASPIRAIVIPTAASMPAKVTTYIDHLGQLPADYNMGRTTTGTAEAFDSLGVLHEVYYKYTKIDDNTWMASSTVTGAETTPAVTGNIKVVQFDPNGMFSSVADATPAGTVAGPPYVISGCFSAPIDLDAHAQTATTIETAITFLDQKGAAQALGVKATCTTGYDGTNDAVWKLEFYENSKMVGSQTYTSTGSTALPVVTLSDGSSYTFDPATTVNLPPGVATATAMNEVPPTVAGTNNPLIFQPTGNAGLMTINQNYNELRQYAGEDTFKLDSDGYAAGVLTGQRVDDKGVIYGTFSNGEQMALGQLATAIFVNQAGLERSGNTTFRESNNSGAPQIGTAGSGGRGVMQAGVLEMSNVDLGEEFTNMIVTQRGFQANSRTITTSDEMLQELMSLKR